MSVGWGEGLGDGRGVKLCARSPGGASALPPKYSDRSFESALNPELSVTAGLSER